MTHIQFHLDIRHTFYLVVLQIFLLIISAYRLVQAYSTEASDTIRKPACFWVLQILFELLVFAGLLAISIPAWFPKPPPKKGDKGSLFDRIKAKLSPA